MVWNLFSSCYNFRWTSVLVICLKWIAVWTTDNTSSFETFLSDLDTRIVNEDIKLIVIDSIAALVRGVSEMVLYTLFPRLGLPFIVIRRYTDKR